MAAVDDLKAAGFSDDEIRAFVTDKAKTLTSAGFSAKEVTDYLGVAPVVQGRTAKGLSEAWTAGHQRSIAGLVDRGAMPEITLDPHQNKWYERLVGNVSTIVNETPESIAGALAGGKIGAAGGALAGPVGAGVGGLIGGGAGAMYVPEVLRAAYTKAIRDGEITSKTDWLSRVKIAIKNIGTSEAQLEGAKGAAIGAATMGVGRVAGPVLNRALLPAVQSGAISQGTAKVVAGAGAVVAEGTTLAVAPAVIEGRLPESHEFLDAAVLLGGLKGATAVSSRLLKTYEKTGKTPVEVLADAAENPSIKADLVRGTEAEQALRAEVKKQGGEPLDLGDLDFTQGTVRGEPLVSPDSAKLLTVEPVVTGRQAVVTDKGAQIEIGRTDRLDRGGPSQELTDLTFLSQPGDRAYIAYDSAGNVVGFLDLSARPDGAFEPKMVEVHPDARRKGVATSLYDAAKADGLNVIASDKVTETGRTFRQTYDQRAAAADEGVPRAYQKQAADMAATEAFPGTKAQQVLDTPFAQLPQTKQRHQLNLRYIEAPDDVKALLTRMAEVYKPEIDAQRNGTKSWGQTAADARTQLEGLLGPDAQRILEGRQGGDAVNTVELKIRSDMLMQATLDLSAKLEVVRKAGDAVTPAQRAEALESVHKLAMIQSELTGAAAEAGRALQQMKAIKVLRDQGGDIAKMVEIYGRDPDTLLKMLGDMQTPEQLSQLVAKASKPGGWQKFIEYYRASLMSGFLTVGYNIAGNTTFLAQRNFLVEPGAALVGLITRSPDRVTFSEVGARIYGSLYMAPMSMIRSAAAAFKNDGPTGPANLMWEAGQAVSPAPVVNTGVVGKFTKAVYGTNSMLDAMFRELTTQGELYSLATKEAISKGHEPGTMDFFREVKAMVENPTESMLQSADTAATRSVFSTPVGKFGQGFNKFAEAFPPVRLIVPFQQTPTNILKETFRNSPFAPLVDTWRSDIAQGGAVRDKAVAEMAVGSALFTAAVFLAMDGRITGSLDPDPKKKATEMAAGKQPYSYKTDDGQYIPLVRLAPTMGTMIGMAADIVQLQQYMTPDEEHKVGKMAMLTFKNAVTNQTMLAGLTNALKAMDDENSLSRFVNSQAGALVPASGMLGQIASVKDPYMREIYSTLDAIKYKIPGVRETLEPKVDAWGVAAPEADRPLFIAPLKVTKESADKVRTEAARLGVSSSKPPKNVDVGINMGRVGLVELTDQQKTKFATDAGQLTYRIVEPVVNSPLWDKTPDLIQRQIMQDALSAGRSYANDTVLSPDQLQQELMTRAAELQKRLQPK